MKGLWVSAVRRWLEKIAARVAELALEANTSSIVLLRPAEDDSSPRR